MKTAIIFHHNDLDGRCSAAITMRATSQLFAQQHVIELDYKDEVPIDVIKIIDHVYIVDFSFKPYIMDKVLEITPEVVWIDHHKTADEYDYGVELKGLRDTTPKKLAACELTWMYFYPDKEIPIGVKLIGDRDKWAWKMKDQSEPFNIGMVTVNHEPKDSVWNYILTNDQNGLEMIDRIIDNGKTCKKYRDNLCSDYLKSFGFETIFEGYKCFAQGLYNFGSEAFGDKIDQYDICLAFEFDGTKFTVGLYSTKIDVSKIAVKYGGGGHPGASGFTTDELPFRAKK